jgi:hypothetical protein
MMIMDLNYMCQSVTLSHIGGDHSSHHVDGYF